MHEFAAEQERRIDGGHNLHEIVPIMMNVDHLKRIGYASVYKALYVPVSVTEKHIDSEYQWQNGKQPERGEHNLLDGGQPLAMWRFVRTHAAHKGPGFGDRNDAHCCDAAKSRGD